MAVSCFFLFTQQRTPKYDAKITSCSHWHSGIFMWNFFHICIVLIPFGKWLSDEMLRLSWQNRNSRGILSYSDISSQWVVLSWSLLSPAIHAPLGVSHTQFLCPVQILLTVDPYFSYSESKPVRVHITHVHAGVLLIWPTLIVVFLFSDITQFPGLDFILLCNVPCYKIFNTLRKSKVVGVNKLTVNNGKVFKQLPT